MSNDIGCLRFSIVRVFITTYLQSKTSSVFLRSITLWNSIITLISICQFLLKYSCMQYVVQCIQAWISNVLSNIIIPYLVKIMMLLAFLYYPKLRICWRRVKFRIIARQTHYSCPLTNSLTTANVPETFCCFATPFISRSQNLCLHIQYTYKCCLWVRLDKLVGKRSLTPQFTP